jgi:hypothetical protein
VVSKERSLKSRVVGEEVRGGKIRSTSGSNTGRGLACYIQTGVKPTRS